MIKMVFKSNKSYESNLLSFYSTKSVPLGIPDQFQLPHFRIYLEIRFWYSIVQSFQYLFLNDREILRNVTNNFLFLIIIRYKLFIVLFIITFIVGFVVSFIVLLRFGFLGRLFFLNIFYLSF